MEYDWEKPIRRHLDFDKIHKIVPRQRGISVLGVAVAFKDLGEACFIANPDFTKEKRSVLATDLWGDIHGDVDVIYTSQLDADDKDEEVE